MEYEFFQIKGIRLYAPSFIIPHIPKYLPIEKFPTFCGAGEGLGDKFIPDTIRGISMAIPCLIHDVEWAVLPDTAWSFLGSNWRFFNNCLAVINYSILSKRRLWMSRFRCFLYFAGVMLGGTFCFTPTGGDGEDPLNNAVVVSRLDRLNKAVRAWELQFRKEYEGEGSCLFQ